MYTGCMCFKMTQDWGEGRDGTGMERAEQALSWWCLGFRDGFVEIDYTNMPL